MKIHANTKTEDKSTPETICPSFPKVLNVYKPISKTPLEVIQTLQQRFSQYSQIDPATGKQLRIGT